MAVFYNQATISYSGGVASSNIITGEITEVLSAQKNALLPTYSQGEDTVFVVSIVNSGTAPFTGLTITDDLGSYDFGDPAVSLVPLSYVENSVKYSVNGVLQASPAVTATSPLTIYGIRVPGGGSAVIIYAAAANQFAPLGEGASITNTVTIGGTERALPITAQETIYPADTPVLSITKSLDPVTVPENGELTYTFVIQNTGSSPATILDNIVFRDVFDPVISISSVEFVGSAWTAPVNYTYNQATGEFVSAAGQITVPAAEFTQNADTGEWTIQPGTATLTIKGTFSS